MVIDPTRHPLHQLRDEMDRLLTGFFGPAADGLLPAMFRNQPAVNVWEREDALLVEMEVPGVKSQDLDISVAGGELSIRIQRPDVAQEGVTYHRRERPVGAFQRVLRLPVEVNADRVEAQTPRRRADHHPAQGRKRQAAEDQRRHRMNNERSRNNG